MTKLNLKNLKVGRVIDTLRRKFPQYKWRYNARRGAWECGAGYAHWVSSMYDDEDCCPSSLYFYPHHGTPVHVM